MMSIDVLPTIAKLTGFKIPWKVDGVPAGTRTGTTKIFREVDGEPVRRRAWVRRFGYDGVAGEKAMLADNVDAFAPQPSSAARPCAADVSRRP